MATTIDKAHGRIERRTLRTTSLLTLGDKWKGLKQGYEITRERTVAGVQTIDVAFGVTSLSTDQATANALLDFTRDHGKIETELHSVRDVTLGEDACRVRSGSARSRTNNRLIHVIDSAKMWISRLFVQCH